MTKFRELMGGAALAALVWQVPAAHAQVKTATVHGKVLNVAGLPMDKGEVVFAKDHSDPKDAKPEFRIALNAQGTYAASNLPAGDYAVYVVVDTKLVDKQDLNLKAGDDKTLDFDMTRAEYQKGLSDEEKAQIAKYKESLKSSNVVSNLNATLTAVRADIKTATPNFDKDIADMTQATVQKPEESILWGTLADAQSAKADHMAADDRKAGKSPMSDEDVLKLYGDATANYKKAIDLNAASKKPNPQDQATMYNQMGIALARAGKIQESQAAYEAGAKLVPASAGMYYGNEAAVLFNASQQNSALGEAALDAANKAIAAEPTRADPYYVKGQILLQKATLDPKTSKIVAPPGCVEAYQKYLELAPDGKYAASVTEVLNSLGEKVVTKYKAGGKK